MVVTNDHRLRESRSGVVGSSHRNVAKTAGQHLPPTGIQRSIRSNSQRRLTTRASLRRDFSIRGERTATIRRIAQVNITIAFHVMAFGFRGWFWLTNVTLVEPDRIDSPVFRNGKRVHAVRVRNLVVVYFHFTRKALPAIV